MLTLKMLQSYPIWHVEADNRWELAMTFIRMQEYHESMNPAFRSNVFSLEECMDWHVTGNTKKKGPTGSFTFASDWSGFNVPGSAVHAVFEKFTEHSKKEAWLFQELAGLGALNGGKFTLIGTLRRSKGTFAHEYRHALFALDADYRNAVCTVIARYPLLRFRAWILRRYAPDVLEDEIQAYALAGWPQMSVTDEMRALAKELTIATKKYLPA